MLAFKPEIYDEVALPSYEELVEEQKRLKRKRVLKRRRKQKIFFKVSCITAVVAFSVLSIFTLKGYSTISSSRMNVSNLERRRNELEQTKSSMISELEEAKGSVKISEEARYKLSMDYPKDDQVVYLSLGKSGKK